jgi:hypothetical protein
MKAFSIKEFKKHPERKLVLRHYRKDHPEVWAIEEAQAVIGNQLLVKVPQTGYTTANYVLADTDYEIRDTDGNLIGTIEFATEQLTVEEFAQRLHILSVGEIIHFSCGDETDCRFVAVKLKSFNTKLILIEAQESNEHYFHDITSDSDTGKLCKKLHAVLSCYLNEDRFIHIDLCPQTEKELWGVTFDYEEESGTITRRLAVTDCYDLFQSRAEAEKWIVDHSDGSYDSDFDPAYCRNPQTVLIDKWKE